MYRSPIAFLAAAVLVAAGGCGGNSDGGDGLSEDEQVKAALTKFLTAVSDGDEETCSALVDPDGFLGKLGTDLTDEFTCGLNTEAFKPPPADVKVVVSGDKATVTGGRAPAQVARLNRVDGTWLVADVNFE